MLVVPNHHVIVPKTEDLAFYMVNTVTSTNVARYAQQQTTVMSNQNELELSFTPVSSHWVEVYLNGYRVINPRYVTKKTGGIPFEEYNIAGNTIIFANAVTGTVRVICDEVIKPEAEYSTDEKKRGLVIPMVNVQNYDIYKQRFTSDRKASGYANNTILGNTVSTLGLYNTHLTYRVGDALWSDPIAITQPMNGYVRLTEDRRNFLYVPNRNFKGNDGFVYTLITQHGQIGQPKYISITVVEDTPLYGVEALPNVVNEGETITFRFFARRPVPDGLDFPFTLSGTGIQSADIGNVALTGVFTTVNNESIVTYVATEDLKTEANEIMRLTLDGYPTITANVRIIDTSRAPTPSTTTSTTTASPNNLTLRISYGGTCIPLDGTTDFYIDVQANQVLDSFNPAPFEPYYTGISIFGSPTQTGPTTYRIRCRRLGTVKPTYTLRIPQAAGKKGTYVTQASNTLTIPLCE